MRTEALKEVFKMFVSTDELRTYLQKPFKQGGNYFATDAHGMIWVPEKYDLGYAEQEKPNCMAVVPSSVGFEPITFSVLDLSKIIELVAPMVNASRECDSCSGAGYLECDLGHEHECEHCDGDGRIELPNKPKVKDDYAHFNFLGITFLGNQLYRFILACNMLEITEVTKLASKEGNKGQLFQSGDVKFLIMPATRNDDQPLYQIKL